MYNETITIGTHWDCDCDEKYIKSKMVAMCAVCGSKQEDQPDSIASEMEEHGIEVDYSKQSNHGHIYTSGVLP